MKLKLRVDTHDHTIVQHIVKKYSTRHLVSFEGDDLDDTKEKSHTHFYIEAKPDLKLDAIRQWLRTQGYTRRYSLKEIDDENLPIEYLAYCIKKKNYTHNLTADEIAQVQKYDLNVKKDLKEKKQQRKTILQQLDESLEPIWKTTLDKQKVIDAVIDWYKERGTLIREFAIVSQIQTLLLKHYPQYHYTLSKRINEKI